VLATVPEQLKSEIWQPKVDAKTDGEMIDESSISVGDTVRLREVDLQGTVLSVSQKTRQLEVQAGMTKLRLGLDTVEKVASPHGNTAPKFIPVRRQLRGRPVRAELDLRGKRAEEIEWLLDSYLNDASMANLSEVRIIHGFGTGTVRNIVRELLASHPLRESFRPGENREGGDGVTIVKL
jgi:DNA mismatch repair protein MutS2